MPATSTITEWSITRSTGISGFTLSGAPPSLMMLSRIAARSTTAGTPVKSCSRMRLGRNGTSLVLLPVFTHSAIAFASATVVAPPSSNRSTFSSSTLRLTGRRAMSPMVLAASGREK